MDSETKGQTMKVVSSSTDDGQTVERSKLESLRKGDEVRLDVRGGEQRLEDRTGSGWSERWESKTIEGTVLRNERKRGRIWIRGHGGIPFTSISDLEVL